MRRLAGILSLAAISVLLVLLVGCDGDGEEATRTPVAATATSAVTATRAPAGEATRPVGSPKPTVSEEEAESAGPTAAIATPIPTATEAPAGQATPRPEGPRPTVSEEEAESAAPAAPTATPGPAAQPTPTKPPAAAAPSLSAEQARDKLGRATILMNDLPPGYAVMTDEYVDNVKASASYANPAETQAFLDNTGRVLGRTLVYTAEDMVQTALAGLPVGYFSTVNAFQDTVGASQHHAVSVEMIRQGPAAVAQFADLFVDPDAVQLKSVTAATVGDASQAFSLAGQTESEGQLYPLTVLLVTLHRGRATAFIGSIQVGLPPDVHEVERLGRLLVGRIDQEF